MKLLTYILTGILGIITVLCISHISTPVQGQDLLETAFKQSKYFDYTVNIWTTRDSVWRAFLRDSYTIGGGKGASDPIIIRVIKWMLEIIVILWVPLLIFGGIKYIAASGDEWAQKSARTFMINVIIGIVIALSSLALVTLVSSLLNDSRFGQDFSQNT